MWSFSYFSPSSTYKKNKPILKIQDFFCDTLKGWGILESKGGIVKRRFTINAHGIWQENSGKITDHFYFDNNEEELREWNIQLISNESFIATSPSCIGIAKGSQIGNVINFNYRSNLTSEGKNYLVNLSEWWFLIDEKTLIVKAKIKKFGITWANLIVFYQKS